MQLLNALVAVTEQVAAPSDPVRAKQWNERLRTAKQISGTGFWNVDISEGKVGLKTVMNMAVPLLGGAMYDMVEGGAGAGQFFLGDPQDRDVPLKENGNAAEALRLFGMISLMAARGPVLSKDLKKVLDEITREANTKPFSMRVDEAKRGMDYISIARDELGRLSTDVTRMQSGQGGGLKYEVDGEVYKQTEDKWYKQTAFGWREVDEMSPNQPKRLLAFAQAMGYRAAVLERNGQTRTYGNLIEWQQENAEPWAELSAAYEMIRTDPLLSNREKRERFKDLEPLFEGCLDAIWENRVYAEAGAYMAGIRERYTPERVRLDVQRQVDRAFLDAKGYMQLFGE